MAECGPTGSVIAGLKSSSVVLIKHFLSLSLCRCIFLAERPVDGGHRHVCPKDDEFLKQNQPEPPGV